MHYEWRKLRADQLREQARKEAIVILPVATIEQHGPHLPVEGDSMLGEAVAARTAEKVQAKGQEVLVLPALWTGLRRHDHSGQRDLHRRRRRRGEIRTTPRVQTHRAAERAWRQRQCPPPLADGLTPKLGVPIVQFSYRYAATVAIARILETEGGLQHGCEAETAMMMAVRKPRLLRSHGRGPPGRMRSIGAQRPASSSALSLEPHSRRCAEHWLFRCAC